MVIAVVDGERVRSTKANKRLAASVLPDLDWARQEPVAKLRGLLNPEQIEFVHNAAKRIAPMAGPARYGDEVWAARQHLPACWETMYLHTGGWWERECADLASYLLEAIEAADKAQGWNLLTKAKENGLPIHWRTVEYHERLAPDPGLMDEGHVDGGSLLTLDIMLSDPETDFEGGTFFTKQLKEGAVDEGENGENVEDVEHTDWNRGDGMLFISHKEHNVRPLTHGKRNVMVLELWQGDPASCPHRCCSRWECPLAFDSTAMGKPIEEQGTGGGCSAVDAKQKE
jgi:hypothetical protein